ncbi:MAG: hypothetical protein V3V97_11385 [Hyphomicrobiaceae bacterium]
MSLSGWAPLLRRFLIVAANIGPNRFVTDIDAPSTCRSESGQRTYIITARRITSS